MSALPSALVLVNQDLTPNVQAMLIKQLFISETLDGYTFDSNVEAVPEYIQLVKAAQARIMVIRPFTELQNRELFDVVLFVKMGLASVETNKFGPPGFTLPVVNLYWGNLGFR